MKPDIKNLTSQWFVDHVPYNIIWTDENSRIVYANPSICETLQYTQRELEKMLVYDINPYLTKEKWNHHWEEVRKKETDHFKTTHRKKNGEEQMVEISSLFFSNNGKELICSIIRDISESNYYRTILEKTENAISVGGWKWNLMDKTVLASEVALCIFGVERPEELLPSNLLSRFTKPDQIKSAFREAVRNGTPYDLTLRVQLDGEDRKWIRCIGSPQVKNGKTEKIFGTYQDVTEQKNREYLLKLSSEVIDHARDIIFIWERSGKLYRFNQSAEIQLGFSKEELSNKTIYDMDSTISPEWWSNHFDDLMNQGSLTFEWVVTRKDNTRFPVEIIANLVPHEGRYLNCAVIRNITDRKLKEAELREALDEVRDLKNMLEIENEYLQEEIKTDHNFEDIICQSETYKKVLSQIEKVAKTESTILITGESGTGKELLARSAHQLSKRSDKPLIKVNCAALPKDLIESELFGHRKGAFTGAISDKLGKFSLADYGTIFLDEIGELPLELQPKLLRVLQEGEFDRLGDDKTTYVDIRVIAATNRDLEQMVKDGKFREDLYYRLNVFPVHNIPLRERKEDITPLAQFFLEKYSTKSGKHFKRISKKTIEALLKYDYPGNIRELENIIERAVIIESGNTLFPGSWLPTANNATLLPNQFLSFEEHQKQIILDVLAHTKWRVSGEKGAAKILGLKDKTLFAKMKKLGIRKEDYLRNE